MAATGDRRAGEAGAELVPEQGVGREGAGVEFQAVAVDVPQEQVGGDAVVLKERGAAEPVKAPLGFTESGVEGTRASSGRGRFRSARRTTRRPSGTRRSVEEKPGAVHEVHGSRVARPRQAETPYPDTALTCAYGTLTASHAIGRGSAEAGHPREGLWSAAPDAIRRRSRLSAQARLIGDPARTAADAAAFAAEGAELAVVHLPLPDVPAGTRPPGRRTGQRGLTSSASTALVTARAARGPFWSAPGAECPVTSRS